MSALWPQADLIIRTRLHQAKSHTTFPGMVFGTSHARMIRNVRHSTSGQSFYLCCHSGWVDVPNCSWNCQLAVGDNGPIPCSLAIIVGHLLGNDVAGRCAGGPPNSICFFSSDERRVAPFIGIPAVQTKCPLWVISGHRTRSASCPLHPQKRTSNSAAPSPLCAKSGLVVMALVCLPS